jgi:hypothetical protein
MGQPLETGVSQRKMRQMFVCCIEFCQKNPTNIIFDIILSLTAGKMAMKSRSSSTE